MIWVFAAQSQLTSRGLLDGRKDALVDTRDGTKKLSKRRLDMDRNMINTRCLWGIAALVLLFGCLIAASIIMSAFRDARPQIAEVHQNRSQHVEIPGEVDLELSRKGAYAVYYVRHKGAYIHAEWPPRLDCGLTSKKTGEDIALVPDYVPTNRYWTNDGNQVGVLIYSTTVKNPGLYTLSCNYPNGREGPKLVLAIGPNYILEFLRLAGRMGGSLLRGAGVLCGSFVLSIGVAVLAFVGRRNKRQVVGGLDE
jgi:hypothetical protein